MGRRQRMLVAGGIYHVYNRVSRGEHAFRGRLASTVAASRGEDVGSDERFQRADAVIAKSIESGR